MYRHHTAQDYRRLMDDAKACAQRQQRQASDDFWRERGDALRRALRAASRFAASLARHQRLRGRAGA